jgi:GntR family transcriptional repressor for pyruvate dehydrogenase complex
MAFASAEAMQGVAVLDAKVHPEREQQGSRVVGELVTLIEQRQYAPGERLPSERDLAERFSVGRGVIREALTTLESMRYLERRPNSGLFLCRRPDATSLEALVLFSDLGLPLDPVVVAQCLEVRRLIEVQATKLACIRRTDDDLAALRKTLAAFESNLEVRDKVADLDYEFHMTIFQATQNKILVRLVTPFYMMSRHRRALYFVEKARCEASHEQHRELLAAIDNRDEMQAERIMAAHIGRVEEYFFA